MLETFRGKDLIEEMEQAGVAAFWVEDFGYLSCAIKIELCLLNEDSSVV